MKKLIDYCWLLVFLIGCASGNTYGEIVKISGLVVDEDSKNPLNGASVELGVFQQGSIFSMGSYVLRNEVVTDADGRFEFSVKTGKSIQIKTKALGAELYGGLLNVDSLVSDQSQIVIENRAR